jgi:hypothetical protein
VNTNQKFALLSCVVHANVRQINQRWGLEFLDSDSSPDLVGLGLESLTFGLGLDSRHAGLGNLRS